MDESFLIDLPPVSQLDPSVLDALPSAMRDQILKHVAQIGNFKNVALSVAKRHQRLLCSYLADEDFFGQRGDSGPGGIFGIMHACISNLL